MTIDNTPVKWSAEAWRLAEPVYRRILELPFVRELAAGTLSAERFRFYIGQDALYIANYARVLAHIASRLPETDMVEAFLRFALDGVMVERSLHASFLDGAVEPDTPTPVNIMYMAHESALGLGPVEVEAAAILPCFWVYRRVGGEILAGTSPDNPYYRWIATYGDRSFAEATDRAIAICDRLAEAATPAARAAMTEAFLRSTAMERLFWESAYNLEKPLI